MKPRKNKHGFTGVRKRCTPPTRIKCYYARIDLGEQQYVYSKMFLTAEEAGAEFQRMKRELRPSSMTIALPEKSEFQVSA